MKNINKKQSAGFTLIELIVVAAIIGIIASITVVGVSKYRERARTAQTLEEVRSFQHAAAIYFAANSSYPTPSNASESCTNGNFLAPNVCCINQNGCDYGGTTLSPATFTGDTASNESVPKWLAKITNIAHAALLGGALPELPHQPPQAIANGITYHGIFYSCTNYASDKCYNAQIIWSQSTDSCTKGNSHTDSGEGSGVCEQDIASSSVEDGGGLSDEDCTNGVDDDGDSDIDCEDADCSENPTCTPTEYCDNSIDDDGDNDIDCSDTDCSGDPACGLTEDCSNGVDDDSDTYIDCDDPDCSSDPSCQVAEDCSTSTDEDGDGEGQCGDNDCGRYSTNPSWSSETYYSYDYCSDGVLTSGSGSGSCYNGQDEDSDGCTDGTDSDCGGSDTCENSIDDNCDGTVDEGCEE